MPQRPYQDLAKGAYHGTSLPNTDRITITNQKQKFVSCGRTNQDGNAHKRQQQKHDLRHVHNSVVKRTFLPPGTRSECFTFYSGRLTQRNNSARPGRLRCHRSAPVVRSLARLTLHASSRKAVVNQPHADHVAQSLWSLCGEMRLCMPNIFTTFWPITLSSVGSQITIVR